MKIRPALSVTEQFENAQKVEVLKIETGNMPVWYAASVLRSAPIDQKKDKIYVEYKTLTVSTSNEKPLREFVEIGNVRPSPPRELRKLFKAGEMVEAFVKHGWRKGQVLKILEKSKYQVSFKELGNEVRVEELDIWALRDIKEWSDGSWVPPPFHSQKNGTVTEIKSSKDTEIRVKFSGNSMGQFSKGTLVEVRSDEEGYKGAWYMAVIISPMGNNQYLVQYKDLMTDDETEPLKETAKATDIRPSPPIIQQEERFQMLDEVDAWYNDGWWVGIISKVLSDLRYEILFSKDEELEFTHSELRPHQEWIGGKWIVDFRRKSKLLLKSKLSKLMRKNDGEPSTACFTKGQQVEVKSYEDGCRNSWYPATILRALGNGNYLVQHLSLKNDSQNKLEEETDVEFIRPCLPKVKQIEPFKPLEEVDALYRGGWWVGQICKVLKGSKYSVYFKDSEEVLEFPHAKLRPHQDWINHHWIPANGGWMPRSA